MREVADISFTGMYMAKPRDITAPALRNSCGPCLTV